jgi:hypothetical protein
MRFLSLASALKTKNFSYVNEHCRWICNYRPLANDTYRLFSLCLSQGPAASIVFGKSWCFVIS